MTPALRVSLCLALALVSAQASGAPLGEGQVLLTEREDEDSYEIRGNFRADATPQEVFKVLSDYEGLRGVIKSLSSSTVLERRGPLVLVEQTLVGRFLFFSRDLRLRLRIQEQSPWRIVFSSEGPAPFRRYEGSWSVSAEGGSCSVVYALNVSRGDLAPLFVERRVLRENSTGLLEELKAEVERRVSKAQAAALPGEKGQGSRGAARIAPKDAGAAGFAKEKS